MVPPSIKERLGDGSKAKDIRVNPDSDSLGRYPYD
jgi:hypothetical protein